MSRAGISPRVGIVGGGLAGMTTALRLAERGYDVSLYESEPILGGNVSARQVDGVYHDVYPHMYPDWYLNFWRLIADLGIDRAESFEPRWSVRAMKPDDSRFYELTNGSSPQAALRNVLSGIAPPADLVAHAYSILDLACDPIETEDLLGRVSVNGFLKAKPYITERAALLHDALLLTVWSVHSEETSAASCQAFVREGLRMDRRTPFLWLLRGNSAQNLVDPCEARLLELGCHIQKHSPVLAIELVDSQVRLTIDSPDREPDEPDQQVFDSVVLAVPPDVLARLAYTPAPGEGARLVDRRPELYQLRRLRSEPIPVVDLYFKRKLEGLPKENVGLLGSRLALSFLDLSQIWPDPHFESHTALTLAASDYYSLPPTRELDTLTARAVIEAYAYEMIEELHDYLPVFDPGSSWKMGGDDIDWERTAIDTNETHRLFINDVGSHRWRPGASFDELPEVFFAGDYCSTTVDMATVEAAVESGLAAARAVRHRHGLGEPIEIESRGAHPEALLQALKLAWAPQAFAAKIWSELAGLVEPSRVGRRNAPGRTVARVAAAPLGFAADWAESAANLWQRILFPAGALGRGSGSRDAGRSGSS